MTNPNRFYIWTDFGGVLTPPIESAMANFCIARGIKPAELKQSLSIIAKRYDVADPMALIDRPVMTEARWLTELNDLLSNKLPRETLADAWFDGRPANADWIAVLKDLKALGHLSNMVPTWDAHWRRMIDADALFDDVALSFEMQSRKPEPEIFEKAAKLSGLPADRCILVDDLKINCDGAITAGWQAIHFIAAPKAATELASLMSSKPRILETNL